MPDNIFHFSTTWTLPCDAATAWEYIGRVTHYPAWWPGMKQVEVVKGSEMPIAIGSTVRFTVASPLYTLRYSTRVTEYKAAEYMNVDASGDLAGTGRWTFKERGGETDATFVWHVALTPPFLHAVSHLPFVRPVMRFFHNRLMEAGERGIRAHLAGIK